MTENTETRIEEAVEHAAEAEADRSAAAADLAEGEAAAQIAQAAAVTVATTENIAALAETTAAKANQQAAGIVAEAKEELSWLQQHAAQTDTSLSQIQASQTQLVQQVSPMMEALTKMQTLMETSLNHHKSAETQTQIVIPENQSEAEAGQPEADLKKPAQRKKRWI